jgi:hypothetical protein
VSRYPIPPGPSRRRLGLLSVALAVGLAAGSGASATAPMTTCTVATLGLTAVSEGVALTGADARGENCFGGFGLLGVHPRALGFPARTVNDFPELRAVLARWRPVDGVPGVGQWIALSPAVAAGMRRAGIDPVRFLQWLNENDLGAPWPPFLPRPRRRLTPPEVLLPVARRGPTKSPRASGARRLPPAWAAVDGP